MSVRPLTTHPTLRDPLTGLRLQAIGFRRDGRAIWPVMGGAPDDGAGAAGAGDQAGQQSGQQTGDGQQAGQAGQQSGQAAGTAGQQQSGQQQAGHAGDNQEVKDLPDWAQKIIADARKDAGDYRTAAKTAADKAQADLVEKLQVALGVKPDPATDPAELARQLTTAQTTARDSAVQLAVYRVAGTPTLQADPDALLDSTSFMASLKDLDHKAADFGGKVEAAIKAAIEKNPKLKAVQAAGRSGGQFTGGPGEGQQRPTSLNAAIAAHEKAATG